MKAHTRTALTLLVGIGLGATTVEMLRAQGKQPVYFIYQTELTGDAATYAKNYVAHIPRLLNRLEGASWFAEER
jgi:hypothetical protein